MPLFWTLIPVIILEAINFSNFSLSKGLLSDLLLTRRTGETSRVVRSFQCTDHMICDSVPTRPAKLQAGLRDRHKWLVEYISILKDNTNIFHCLTHLQTTYTSCMYDIWQNTAQCLHFCIIFFPLSKQPLASNHFCKKSKSDCR